MKCEICENRNELLCVKHHITSRSKGGSNKPSNIAYLCNNCHMDVHYGIYIIEGRFNSTEGNIVVFRKWFEPPIITEVEPEVWLFPDYETKRKKYLKLIREGGTSKVSISSPL